MIRGEETNDPVTEHTALGPGDPTYPDPDRPEPGGEGHESSPRLAVDIADDGSATIDGEPVPVVPGEPVDVAILDTLHGYARSRNASVGAAISDPSADCVVVVEVAPDGSSTVLERIQEDAADHRGQEPDGPEEDEATAGTGVSAGSARTSPVPEHEADGAPRSAGPRATGFSPAGASGWKPRRLKPRPQSDDEYQGPGLLQRPAVIGGVALGVVVLVMGSLVAVGSSGDEQNRATGTGNGTEEVPGTGEAQMYPPPTGGPDPFVSPSPSASSSPPDLALSVPHTDDPDPDNPKADEGDGGDSDHGADPAHRGVALNPGPGTAKALADSGVSWFHNWTSSTGKLGKPGDTEYVPMIWGPGSVTKAELGSAKKESGGNLLTFHEPDSPTQSAISPERALDLWPRLEKTGLRLSSPAVAGGAARKGGWLDRFMRGAEKRKLRVDFISVHWYGSDFGPGATQRLRSYLRAVHERYNKPVWLTEYALIDFTGNGPRYPGRKKQTAFIKSSTEMLGKLDFVERYAWSALTTDTNPTGLYDGSAPNARGRAYREAD